MFLTSWIFLVFFHKYCSGFFKHLVLISLTSSIVYSLTSRQMSFSSRKSRITKYKLQRSSLRDKSILLWALRLAKLTVPLKSAFFLYFTGFLLPSRCLLARPKSTIYTYLWSWLSTKLEALTSLWIKPRSWTSSIASNISISNCTAIFKL